MYTFIQIIGVSHVVVRNMAEMLCIIYLVATNSNILQNAVLYFS